MASYSTRSNNDLWKGNRIKLPAWTKVKDFSQIKADHRRDLWWQLIPYIYEPTSKNNRNRLRALQLKRLIKLTKKKERTTKRTSRASRRLRSLTYKNRNRFERLGGGERLVHAPSRSQFIEQRYESFKNLIEVYFIVRTFLRLHLAEEEQDVWPSIDKSIKVISGKGISAAYKDSCDPNAEPHPSEPYQLFELARKSRNPLEQSWGQFKNSAPIIFGMFEATFTELDRKCLYPPAPPRKHGQNSTDTYAKAKKNFIKSFDALCTNRIAEVLAMALYAQNIMTSDHIRNTKKPAIDPYNVIWLPEVHGLAPLSPKLTLLSNIELDIFNA